MPSETPPWEDYADESGPWEDYADESGPRRNLYSNAGLLKKLRATARIAPTSFNIPNLAVEYYRDPEKIKDWGRAGLEGLRGRPIPEGASTEEGVANIIGRYGPSISASLAFPAASVGRAVGGAMAKRLGTSLAARGVTSLGGLATRMGAGGATAGLASLAGSTAAGDPNIPAAKEVAEEFAIGEGLGKGLEVGVPAAWRTAKTVGRGLLERGTDLYSRVPASAWKTLREAPESVAKYAREGMTYLESTNKPIAEAMLRAQELGRSAQAHIKNTAKGASKQYEGMMEYLKGDESGVKFPVAQSVFDKMEPFIKNQTSYRSLTQGKTTKEHAEIFNHFYDRIKSTLQEGMDPGEVADLLQQMTTEQKTYRGTPLSAHLAELKTTLLDSIPGDYRLSSEFLEPKGWNIRGTRDEYKAAKEFQREAAPYLRKEEPVLSFERIMSAGGKTSEALKNALAKSPAFAEKINQMRIAKGGAAFAPKIGELPRTGLTGAALRTLANVLRNPLAAAQLPFMAIGASPRAAMEIYLKGSKLAGLAEKGSATVRKAVSNRVLPTSLSALLKKSREKKELP